MQNGPPGEAVSLSRHAERDLNELLLYLDSLPDKPALRIASSIQKMLLNIAESPYVGVVQSELTLLAGVEVRSRVVRSYRIYMVGDTLEIIGVLHGARDITRVLTKRLQ